MTTDSLDSRSSTGVSGLDDILAGGFPRGRPSLLLGAPGSGKTLLSMAFACHAINEEGTVYASFEEHPHMLERHARFLGHAPAALADSKGLCMLDMRPGYEELASTAAVELGPVRARIEHAVSETGAGRLVLDSIDSLFFIFGARASTQRELLRLIEWIRRRGVTTILTSFHQPETGPMRHLELIPHVCDCIVELEQNVKDKVMTRYLRVAKYRGSNHGTNVYPFIIDGDGIFVLPITSTRLNGPLLPGGFSTGIEALDDMLGGQGIRAGTLLQISGRTGTGKTILAASLVRSACDAGLRALYVSFEESTPQMLHNLNSAGNDLSGYLADAPGASGGRLHFEPIRAVELSLEGHLVNLIRLVERVQPDLLVLDPVSSLGEQGSVVETKSAVLRLVNHLADCGKTMLFTELLPDSADEHSSMNISSIVDTWIRLRLVENNGEFSRLMHVAKSRGVNASNQVREFHISSGGPAIDTPYTGPGEMVVGTAKRAREQEEARQRIRTERRLETLRRQLSAREKMITLRRELEEATERQDLERLEQEIEALEKQLANQTESRELVRRQRSIDRETHEP